MIRGTPISEDVAAKLEADANPPTPPEWLLTCRLMLLLHKTEKELSDGMSPWIIQRLAWVLQQDAEYEDQQRAEQEADQRLGQKMNRSR